MTTATITHMKFLARQQGGTDYRCVRDYQRGGEVKLVEGDPCVAYVSPDRIGGVIYWHVVGTYHVELVPDYLFGRFMVAS